MLPADVYKGLVEPIPLIALSPASQAGRSTTLRPNGRNSIPSSEPKPLTPEVVVTWQNNTFSFDISFIHGNRQIGARVLSAFAAGEVGIRTQSSSIYTLPTKWLEKHATQCSVLLALKKRYGDLIPFTYAHQLESSWVNREGHEYQPLRAYGDPLHLRAPSTLFEGTLRDYQKQGLDWLVRRYTLEAGGILADDMGLGKTIQAIACLAHATSERKIPHLVIAPTSVHENWLSELSRFAPSLTLLKYYGPNRELSHADVIVTTYGVLLRDGKRLAAQSWGCIILDEAQAFKNPRSRIARSQAITRQACFALTGTPFENNYPNSGAFLR